MQFRPGVPLAALLLAPARPGKAKAPGGRGARIQGVANLASKVLCLAPSIRGGYRYLRSCQPCRQGLGAHSHSEIVGHLYLPGTDEGGGTMTLKTLGAQKDEVTPGLARGAITSHYGQMVNPHPIRGVPL